MSAKHTPGPWHVAEHDHGIVVCTDSAKKSQYGASRYAAIGGFNRNDQEQLAEALANARLIAAAPDLYNIAERVAHLNKNAGEIGAGMLASLVEDAILAIAKSTGKQ